GTLRRAIGHRYLPFAFVLSFLFVLPFTRFLTWLDATSSADIVIALQIALLSGSLLVIGAWPGEACRQWHPDEQLALVVLIDAGTALRWSACGDGNGAGRLCVNYLELLVGAPNAQRRSRLDGHVLHLGSKEIVERPDALSDHQQTEARKYAVHSPAV